MIRVTVMADRPSGDWEYDALLVGWVNFEDRVMALVVTDDDQYPWMIHQSRIRVKL